MRNDRHRLALVGAGRWGRRLLPELLLRFDVAACCTTGGAAGAEWLREHHPDVRAATDLDALLADDAIDAVAIATPIPTHAGLAERALRAGKHVFVEKPLATSAHAAERLAGLAAAERRVLFTGHILLHDPLFEQLAERVRADGPAFVRTTWRKLGTFDSDLLWNLASHHVSAAIALAGEPGEVELVGGRGHVTERDWALLRLGFPAGVEALVEVDRVAPRPSRTVAVETRSGMRLVWDGDVLYELRGEHVHELARGGGRALGRELDAFRAAVAEGAPFPSSPRHAATVVAALERVAPPGAPPSGAPLAAAGPGRR